MILICSGKLILKKFHPKTGRMAFIIFYILVDILMKMRNHNDIALQWKTYFKDISPKIGRMAFIIFCGYSYENAKSQMTLIFIGKLISKTFHLKLVEWFSLFLAPTGKW